MPLRDFVCQTCNDKQEHLVGAREDPPTKCGECGADGAAGLIVDTKPTPTGAPIFGPGFFKTGGY